MKKMVKNDCTNPAFWFLLAVVTPTVAWGHPGGLNPQGCHTNRKTGEYHCHNGKSSGGGSAGSGSIEITPVSKPTQRSQRPSNNKSTTVTVSPGPVSLVSVGDGDTIRVLTNKGQKVTVRLACIDAPETAQGESGTNATMTLRMLLGSGPLELNPFETDRYGRTVAEVFANGRNVNLEMVGYGAAFVYRDYLGDCDANAYLDAESRAEKRRLGVWRWNNVEYPWDFRKNRRGGG